MERRYEEVHLLQNHNFFKLRIDRFNAVSINNIAILDPDFSLTSASLNLFDTGVCTYSSLKLSLPHSATNFGFRAQAIVASVLLFSN